MLKRTLGTCLALAILMAPCTALAAPQLERVETAPTWIERVWGELKELVGVSGPRERPQRPSADRPRSLAAGEEGGPHLDPGG